MSNESQGLDEASSACGVDVLKVVVLVGNKHYGDGGGGDGGKVGMVDAEPMTKSGSKSGSESNARWRRRR